MRLAREFDDASYNQADLADQSSIPSLIKAVLDRHGRIDVLVNNAGIVEVIPHADLKRADADVWRRMYDVNVIAPWLLICEAEQALRDSSTVRCPSCILNISSHAGIRPKGSSIPHAVSKSALNHMTRLLAVTLAPAIRVNALAPGLVDTPLSHGREDLYRTWAQRAPMRRPACTDDVAHLAEMTIESTYLTGEVILVDGGLNLT
jgi:NAD(P)-dependent dehydrogenase (short-subunit alcohol dehydrogenase family)